MSTRIPSIVAFFFDSLSSSSRENPAEANFHSLRERQHDEREIEDDFNAADERAAEEETSDTAEGHHQVKSAERHIGSILHYVCALIVEIDRDVVTLTVKWDYNESMIDDQCQHGDTRQRKKNSLDHISGNFDRIINTTAFRITRTL